MAQQLEPALGPTHLYLGGGFTEETKSVVLTAGSVMDVPALESTQQEADTRIILHTLYSVKNEGVDRVVIHANDTDIIKLVPVLWCNIPQRPPRAVGPECIPAYT